MTTFKKHHNKTLTFNMYLVSTTLVVLKVAYSSGSNENKTAKLSEKTKDSFLLKEEAGLSVKGIATVLNTSFKSSKTRLRYDYENLRQCLHISRREIL
ncbi:MAG: hypothetical protein ACI9LX_001868 [Paraglaciecola sp.]|jgi:hypothetical protein